MAVAEVDYVEDHDYDEEEDDDDYDIEEDDEGDVEDGQCCRTPFGTADRLDRSSGYHTQYQSHVLFCDGRPCCEHV
jgi:hypothetical protein